VILVNAGVIRQPGVGAGLPRIASSAGTGEFSLAVRSRVVCSPKEDSPVSTDDKPVRRSGFFLPRERSNWKTIEFSVNGKGENFNFYRGSTLLMIGLRAFPTSIYNLHPETATGWHAGWTRVAIEG
jgi:hypothetical protein